MTRRAFVHISPPLVPVPLVSLALVLVFALLSLVAPGTTHFVVGTARAADPYVAEIEMKMAILPGTAAHLRDAVQEASESGAKMLVVHLDTPGGMLPTTQEMVQEIFQSPIPVVIYVSPSGGSAASAGVFITMAGHVAAMAPGTTIGAAHPVLGDGKDIQGDMRQKAENIAVAMIRSISEQRGRNVEWAERAIRESATLTEKEAVNAGVVDLVADDVTELLSRIKGKEVKVRSEKLMLDDYSRLPRRTIPLSVKNRMTNVLANPTVAALLWLGATTGLSLELYHPGAILPGVVGVICLILALLVTQVIPVNQGALALLVVGALLLGAELFVPSGILAAGGVIALVLGAVYLVDVGNAPGLGVNLHLVLPAVVVLGAGTVLLARGLLRIRSLKPVTGEEGLIGLHGKAMETISKRGKVFVNGEVWNAELESGVVTRGEAIEVVAKGEGLTLRVRKLEVPPR